jgi:hypothetical protein
MPMAIEIRDVNNEGFLTFDLFDLLEQLRPEAEILNWHILDLEATGNLGPEINMLDFESSIAQSRDGVRFTWEQLVDLSRKLFQIMNLVLVGQKNSHMEISLMIDKKKLYESSEIVIEAIDSSLWLVYAKKDEIIHRLQLKFKQTFEVSLS